TYHVIESTNPAEQIVAFARHNRVDHIVIGARGSSVLRRYLGSVSAHVVAEAPCTVTVVRLHRNEMDDSKKVQGRFTYAPKGAMTGSLTPPRLSG
ncbi:MAG: universal stress protein, partial [Pseudolabrys sp.]